jgi:hypothetical protein
MEVHRGTVPQDTALRYHRQPMTYFLRSPTVLAATATMGVAVTTKLGPPKPEHAFHPQHAYQVSGARDDRLTTAARFDPSVKVVEPPPVGGGSTGQTVRRPE